MAPTEMNDSLPVSLAILILLVNAIYSAKWGILSILAAGIATVVAVAMFLLIFHFLPGLTDTFFDLALGWKALTLIGAIVALVVFVLVRFPIVWGLQRLLGPDSKLHFFADGFAGAALSLLPSAIVILFLFSCFRIGGTIRELHYVAALGREGIENMGGKIPPYPDAGIWREEIESLPGITVVLDQVDPISPAEYRNAAAVVLLDQASATRLYFSEQEETKAVFSSPLLRDLDQEPSIQVALEKQNRAALVLDSLLREKAQDSQLFPALKTLQLRPVLERFVESLTPPADPGIPTPSN